MRGFGIAAEVVCASGTVQSHFRLLADLADELGEGRAIASLPGLSYTPRCLAIKRLGRINIEHAYE